MPITCALIPRFALLVALSERRDLVERAVALAPEPGERRRSARRPAQPRRSACGRAWGSARRWRAARGWPWCPPTPSAPRRRGRLSSAGSSRSAPRWVPAGGRSLLLGRWPARLWGGNVRRPHPSAAGGRRPGAAPERGSRAVCPPTPALAMPRRRGTRRRPPGGIGGVRKGGFVVVPDDAARAQAFLAPLPVRLLADRLEGRWGADEPAGDGSGSTPWASSRRCPTTPSPTASASPAWLHSRWRAESRRRCGPAPRARTSPSASSCRRRVVFGLVLHFSMFQKGRPIVSDQKEDVPYIDRSQLENSAGWYLNSPLRAQAVDRLLVDSLVAAEKCLRLLARC